MIALLTERCMTGVLGAGGFSRMSRQGENGFDHCRHDGGHAASGRRTHPSRAVRALNHTRTVHFCYKSGTMRCASCRNGGSDA